ncbi:MAG: prepilin-type N-terminal cleavage/methylation domain-containing protein [Candidatus Omnitrophica bacterium]|nr:hypothetical protein [bacterium]NUN95577.1 prepilin-type N-terminal cleavage/methylation domain-containing protein [Candidatus Omnitrophota bacterium]
MSRPCLLPSRLRQSGFTLIELLIVIAIILILIAIALPNFLEAQIRAKVTRVKADLRTVATALEAYFVDFTTYPPDSRDDFNGAEGLKQLTTPLKYLPSLPFDVFVGDTPSVDGRAPYFALASTGLTFTQIRGGLRPQGNIHAFVVNSHGPDTFDWFQDENRWPFNGPAHPCPTPTSLQCGTTSYTPTNGTLSTGNIHHFGGEWKAGHWCLDSVLIRGSGWNLLSL